MSAARLEHGAGTGRSGLEGNLQSPSGPGERPPTDFETPKPVYRTLEVGDVDHPILDAGHDSPGSETPYQYS
jgi:hypothetical protein